MACEAHGARAAHGPGRGIVGEGPRVQSAGPSAGRAAVRGRGRGASTARRDRGFVTAEAAVALPVLAVFAMSLLWALLAGAAQIQCVDAARAGARAAARQEPQEAVVAAVKAAAPRGARVEVRRDGDLVRVRVVAASPGPGPLSVDLEHEAAALAEETVGRSGAATERTGRTE